MDFNQLLFIHQVIIFLLIMLVNFFSKHKSHDHSTLYKDIGEILPNPYVPLLSLVESLRNFNFIY